MSTSKTVVMLLDNHHGVDRRIRMESSLLLAAGAEVRVIGWDRRPAGAAIPDADVAEPPETVIRINVPTPRGGGAGAIWGLLRFCLAAWSRRRELLAGADTLVAHDIYLLPLGWLLARRHGLPLVYDAHEDFAALERGRYPAFLLRVIERVEGYLARDTRAVIVPGDCRRRRWLEAGIAPVVLENVGPDRERLPKRQASWDLAYCGMLSPERRLDVLLDVARMRPQLRVAIAGHGRLEPEVAQAAAEIPNLEFLVWPGSADEMLAAARVVYYGQDAAHPYGDLACPNTLYQALRVGRPLIYFCGGEPAALHRRFDIGRRCEPTATAVADAVSELSDKTMTEQVRAWEWLTARRTTDTYVQAVLAPRGTLGTS